MQSNPTVGEIARVALITFSDEARTLIPLSDLAFAQLPEVLVEGGTNFAAAFRGLRAAIDAGMGSLPKGTPVYRPVAFFMSDGEHQARENWSQALDQHIRDPNWKYRPEVVAFGFGDANKETLRRIDPAVQVREIMNALVGSIRTTSTSFRDPNQTDGLHLEAPSEFFTPLPPMQT
jgi:uncharacterized protein YegL